MVWTIKARPTHAHANPGDSNSECRTFGHTEGNAHSDQKAHRHALRDVYAHSKGNIHKPDKNAYSANYGDRNTCGYYAHTHANGDQYTDSNAQMYTGNGYTGNSYAVESLENSPARYDPVTSGGEVQHVG